MYTRNDDHETAAKARRRSWQTSWYRVSGDGPLVTTRRGLALSAAAVLSVAASVNWAQQSNELNIDFHGFQDTRGVTVLSPTVDLAQDYTERTALRLNYGLDAISAASDSCARCHHDGINSHRQVVGLSATRKYGDTKLTMGGAYSKENFYRATTGLASVSRDVANGNATIAAGFSFSLNQPTLHPTPEIENQYQSGGFATFTQTLSRTSIAQLGYEVSHIAGYQNNPYLRATVNGEMVLGQVPDARTRQTFSARLRQALPANTFLEADYRRYVDDWDVTSNTLSVGVSHHIGQTLLLNLAYRRYGQTAAYFWAPEYTGDPQYYTADFRLEPFTSNNYTGRVLITPKGSWGWFPGGTGVTVQYERYQADNGFQAGILTTGLRMPVKVLNR
jgi:Protein of unknown function (DUF3570)